jgi:chromate reductase, NAD(P)H dehydrogenase (quinone)
VTKVLLVSGSLRAESVNSAVLRTAAALAGDRIRTTLYEGMGTLPHFNPDDDPEGGPVPAAVADLRRRLADADAVLFCTPEYAGSLPGSFKNLLDWTVGGGETYGKPVAWINASSRADPDAGSGAHEALRAVLGYTGADIAAAACRRIQVPRTALGADGVITDAAIREEVAMSLRTLADHAARNVRGSMSGDVPDVRNAGQADHVPVTRTHPPI